MSRAPIILIVVLVAIVVAVIALASINTAVAPHRIEKPVNLQSAPGDAAPAK